MIPLMVDWFRNQHAALGRTINSIVLNIGNSTIPIEQFYLQILPTFFSVVPLETNWISEVSNLEM